MILTFGKRHVPRAALTHYYRFFGRACINIPRDHNNFIPKRTEKMKNLPVFNDDAPPFCLFCRPFVRKILTALFYDSSTRAYDSKKDEWVRPTSEWVLLSNLLNLIQGWMNRSWYYTVNMAIYIRQRMLMCGNSYSSFTVSWVLVSYKLAIEAPLSDATGTLTIRKHHISFSKTHIDSKHPGQRTHLKEQNVRDKKSSEATKCPVFWWLLDDSI